MSAMQYRSEWPRRGYFVTRHGPLGEIFEWINRPPTRWHFLRARLRVRLIRAWRKVRS